MNNMCMISPTSPSDDETHPPPPLQSGLPRQLSSSTGESSDGSSAARSPPPKRQATPPAMRPPPPEESLAGSTAALLASDTTSYGDTLVCLAPGLHASRFPLDFDEARSRLHELVLPGGLRRGQVRAQPWSGVHEDTLPGVLRICDALLTARGGLSLSDALNIYHQDEWPAASLRNLMFLLVKRVARSAPIILMSTGAGQQQLGARLESGERFLVPRPADLPPIVAMWTMLGAHQASLLNQQLSRVTSLPLEELEAMMPSTEAKAVLIAAISHVTSKRVLARAQPVSLSRIELAVSRVDTALQRLPKLTEELENTLASERGDALRRASTAGEQLIVAKQIGKAESIIRELETEVTAASRKAALRDPEHHDYPVFFARRWREMASSLDELKHLPRGHNGAIHIEYPDFKRAVESTIQELGGRASSDRQAATIYMGKSTWSRIAELLQDPEHMKKLGCETIPASVSVLKKHKRRSDRSLQPKIDDEKGQLNVSNSKVLKLLLPTEANRNPSDSPSP